MFIPTLPKKAKRIRFVYLDHAAATPTDSSALRALLPYYTKQFGNPGSLYQKAKIVSHAIENARTCVADALHTTPDTIIFTGSVTESANIALFGVCGKKGHIITSAIEHPSVLEPIRHMERAGWSVTYLMPNREGIVSVEAFKKAFKKNTVLVSLMYANNEIGSIQPVPAMGRMILGWRKQHKTRTPYFHVDASQALNYFPLSVDGLHADFVSFNASKIYGPKGVGVLYKRRGIPLQPLTYGGGQEEGFRSGTENVTGIVGLGRAVQKTEKLRERETKRLRALSLYFWKEIQKRIPDVALNGSLHRLPNNLNIVFRGVDGEALVLYLDAYGIAASTGAACATNKNESSHVLRAIGLSEEEIKGSVRFTLGRSTTKQDIDYVMKYLPKIVEVNRYTEMFAKKI